MSDSHRETDVNARSMAELPERWELRRLKEVVTAVAQGWSPLCENRQADEHEWAVLKVGCVW